MVPPSGGGQQGAGGPTDRTATGGGRVGRDRTRRRCGPGSGRGVGVAGFRHCATGRKHSSRMSSGWIPAAAAAIIVKVPPSVMTSLPVGGNPHNPGLVGYPACGVPDRHGPDVSVGGGSAVVVGDQLPGSGGEFYRRAVAGGGHANIAGAARYGPQGGQHGNGGGHRPYPAAHKPPGPHSGGFGCVFVFHWDTPFGCVSFPKSLAVIVPAISGAGTAPGPSSSAVRSRSAIAAISGPVAGPGGGGGGL